MDARYAEWIAGWLERNDPRFACNFATVAMAMAFPELRRVRGHYVMRDSGRAQHWWCETSTGEVVDPTVSQFCAPGGYEEYTGPDPVGKCYWCGALIWEPLVIPGKTTGERGACSEECFDELRAEYGSYD